MSENKKPKLAEVLGVEVNEKFDFVGGGFTHCCYVDSNGWLRDQNDNMCDTEAVFLINNPQYIRHRPRWTEQDVEIAKAIKLLAPAMDYIERIAENRSELYSKLDFGAAYLQIPCIPSMKVGEKIALDDIIGGNT